jgi:diadenosine tetraphosphate (Ap4A) HIT family hydrolase
MVFLRAKPPLVPGQGFIVLKRHCKSLGELSQAEAEALGVVMQRTQRAYGKVLQPERVHFGLYAEEVRHLHLHITPRMAHMPPGNILLTVLGAWYSLPEKVHIRRSFTDEAVNEVAGQLRAEFKSI